MVLKKTKHYSGDKQNQAINVENKTNSINTAVKPEIKQNLRTDITTELNKVYLKQDVLKELLKNELTKSCDGLEHIFSSVVMSAVNIAGQRFVEMKNLPVWYDRVQSILVSNKMCYVYKDSNNVGEFFNKIGKFEFRLPDRNEFLKSFNILITNPIVERDEDYILYGDKQCRYFLLENNAYVTRRNNYEEPYWFARELFAILISSLKDGNPESTPYESVQLWLKNNLIPDGLDEETENDYKMFCENYDLLEPYIKGNKASLYFDKESFKQDVLSGKFVSEFYDENNYYDFNFNEIYNDIVSGKKDLSDFTFFKKNLLECDYKRANISPYTEKQLTDLNLGHWELAEPADAGAIEINVPETEHFIARPPKMDVIKNGVCGIDFGTKSTVVACFKNEARLLRVGEGDFTKAPELEDYENPTVIELRDLAGFVKNYKARAGRPFTEWEQLTVSHQAAEAIMDDKDEKTNYYSVFSELKQWAIDKKRRLMLCDKKAKQ